MAFFIRFFGLSPFVWRFPGLIAGILMIPLLYMILKEMHFPDHMCLAGIVLLASDFMHLTTSRIGTLEPFSILTIMWMYLYMIRYYHTSFYTTPLRKQLVLLLQCGMMMGISIAVKWTACYSAVGLAVLLFTNLIRRFLEYLQAGKNLQTSGTDETSMHIRRTFIPCFLKTTACCFVFFIFIPAVIYWLSYLPDHVWRDGWSIANVWQQNVNMYNYHINLNATHPFQSMWYEWVLDLRPVWYHISTDISGYKHSIACFSNPIVTWAGLPAILYAMYRACRHKDHSTWIITVGYLTAMVPWISLVQRCVFSYHFYPSSIFTVMAVVYMMNDLAVSFPSIKKYIPLIPAAAVILFVLFLPVTAGFGTSLNFIHALEWFESWYFG
jgi:dolichyl-phosphate-mannose--protein O-mannosyl transferase